LLVTTTSTTAPPPLSLHIHHRASSFFIFLLVSSFLLIIFISLPYDIQNTITSHHDDHDVNSWHETTGQDKEKEKNPRDDNDVTVSVSSFCACFFLVFTDNFLYKLDCTSDTTTSQWPLRQHYTAAVVDESDNEGRARKRLRSFFNWQLFIIYVRLRRRQRHIATIRSTRRWHHTMAALFISWTSSFGKIIVAAGIAWNCR
jgi:hypothetical protein